LNDQLITQNYLIIRRDASFMVVTADEKVRADLLPRITPRQLPERGDTEVVQLVLPLKSMIAEDAVAWVKKLLGPFGEVAALGPGNSLIMQDKAGNLRRIVEIINEQEGGETGEQADNFSYPCQYIKARDAEKRLRELMPDTKALSGSGSGSSSDRGRDF